MADAPLPSLAEVFAAQGVLAQHLTNHEPRPGQQAMAEAIFALLEAPAKQTDDESQAECLVIEAETGLGKTLAYLVPAVLSRQRVVVSTATRNLQDQILSREIPLIKRFIDPSLTSLCVKGRQNYLCLHRWHQFRAARQDQLFDDRTVSRIDQWLATTTYAERSECSWLASTSPIWQRINSQSHLCLGSDCDHAGSCFLNLLRQDAAASRLLIVNHHLLFSDLAIRRGGHGEVLPRYQTVIFDEAHHIENVASTFFGFSFSRLQVLDLIGDIEHSVQIDLMASQQRRVQEELGHLSGLLDRCVETIPANPGRFHLQPLFEAEPTLCSLFDTLTDGLHRLEDVLTACPPGSEPWDHYAGRAAELAERLAMITALTFEDDPATATRFTRWYERTSRNLVLSATPIDISSDLQATLFRETTSCVFTSATLTTGGDFRYFCSRIGLGDEADRLRFASPFDYAGQTQIYIPAPPFPEPNHPAFLSSVHSQLEQLVLTSQGRALLLFTSTAAMEQAATYLRTTLPYPILVQGDAPRRQLLDRFSQELDSVLLGVASFWEGVDVPGPSLSLLVIDKLPFEVPSDPVIMARIDQIKAAGGNPFFDFQVPRAVLSLRQGVGRLMRTASDRGVIALLDIRIRTKGYGRRFRASLPPSPVCTTIEEVAAFYQRHETSS